ncbi:MAG: PA14 domain-containing protein [Bacteroidota bacterium]
MQRTLLPFTCLTRIQFFLLTPLLLFIQTAGFSSSYFPSGEMVNEGNNPLQVGEVLTDPPAPSYFVIDPACGQSTGSITFEFGDHPDESVIEFSFDGGSSFLFSSPDNLGVYVLSNLPPGTFPIWYRWGSTGAGQSLGMITLTNQPGPSAEAGPAQTVWVGESTLLEGSGSGGQAPYQYTWLHESGFDYPGIQYIYYQDTFTMLPNFDTLIPVDYGFVDSFDISGRPDDNYFAFQLIGKIDLPITGDYTFSTRSDDGSKLFIGTDLVVNNDGLHGATTKTGTITLTAGTHDIEVQFFERSGSQVLEVYIEGPGISNQLIPMSMLHTGPNVTPNSIVSPLASTTYTLQVTDANGCISTDDVTVSVDTRPQASSIMTDPVCSLPNGSIQFEFADSPLQTQIAFSLDGGSSYPYLANDDAGSLLVDGLAPGFYDLWARWGDGTDAIDLPDQNLVDQPGPIVNAGNDTLVWVGETALLNGTVNGGTDPLSYNWVHEAGQEQSGVEYAYYEGTWNSLPDFDALEAVAYGFIDSFHIADRLNDNSFGFKFQTKIDIVTDGEYTFFTTSDDGSQLFINGQLIVDNDGLHGTRTRSGTINLTAGTYAIVVTFFEKGGGQNLSVKYAGPGVPEQIIPQAVLSTIPSLRANTTVSPTASTTYTFQATDGNGCTATDDVFVQVDTSPRVTVSGVDPVCSGANGQFVFVISVSPLQTDIHVSFDNVTSYPYTISDDLGTGTIENLAPGTYEIWVQWSDGSEAESLGSITLTDHPGPSADAGGDQTIWIGESALLEGVGTGGTSPLTYQWAHLGATFQPGLNYQYYEGTWNSLPDFSSLSPEKTGSTDNFDITPRDQNENFAFVFSGFIRVDQAGIYTFGTRSDDGSILIVSDSFLVDNDGLHGNRTRMDSIYLDTGEHSIEVQFFEKSGNQNLQVFYSGPGVDSMAIPDEVLLNDGRLDGLSEVNPNVSTTYDLTVIDNNGCSATDAVTITVIDIPLFATNDTVYLESGQQVNIVVLANDFDPLGDPLDGPLQMSSPMGGTVQLEVDGSFTYTANAAFVGEDAFLYEVSNQAVDQSAEAKVVLIVSAVDPDNDPPVAIDDAWFVYQFETLNASVATNDFDADGDSPLAFSLINTPAAGTLNFGSSGAFSYTPEADFSGVVTFNYQVCDPGGQCASGSVDIIVKPVLVVDVSVFAFLEGAYDPGSSAMITNLNTSRGLLPGQTPTGSFTSGTPAGNPYRGAPYHYVGSVLEESFAGPYDPEVVDWVLISFRSGTSAGSTVKQVTGLLYADGHIELMEPQKLLGSDGNGYYIVIEHRNHMGVMSPTKVSLNGTDLIYDFRSTDSYLGGPSFGQKEIEPGVFALIAGDIDQENDATSFDINGMDNVILSLQNGTFSTYDTADLNFDGDVNGADAILWTLNNGISSSVPKN